jgi:hypothetical protein
MIRKIVNYICLSILSIGIITVLSVNYTNAQETIIANISDQIELKYEFNTSEDIEYNFDATLKLHNPSLIYPLEFSINTTSARNLRLERLNDSTYSIKSTFQGKINQNYELNILCEILAGNDSICSVSLENITLNSEQINGKEYQIKVNTLNYELPYLRFTTILKVYPNPVFGNSNLYIEYLCDIAGEVEFYLSGLLGQYYFLKKNTIITTGLQKDFIPINYDILSGSYRIEIRTKFGRVTKPFTIIK